MRTCRACGYEHETLMRCDVARRIREVKERNNAPGFDWKANRGKCWHCGVPARTPKSYYCDDCFIGSKPVSVENAVRAAIKKGALKPPSEFRCKDCGAKAKVYDHRDYNKPLEVDPVCHRCNLRRGPAIPYAGRPSQCPDEKAPEFRDCAMALDFHDGAK